MAGDRVAGLVDGGRAALLGDVRHVLRRAGLDGRDRLDDVRPREVRPPVGVRVRERHRADLLDHGRRVPAGDARQLVAALDAVEVGVVVDAAEVEVEDVAAVVGRRRAEPDVAAHAAGPQERRVEPVERDVRGADEVDLLRARLRRADAQLHAADLARHEVGGVEEGVELLRDPLAHERRLVDAVHLHEQLVEREPAAAAHHAAGEHELHDLVLRAGDHRRVDRARRIGAHREELARARRASP